MEFIALAGGELTSAEKFLMADKVLNKLREKSSFVLNKENIYRSGAVMKLFIDGRISVYPTEDTEVHRVAVEALVNKRDVKGVGEDLNKMIMYDREQAALKIISSIANKDERIILMVYGVAHDFSKVVNEHNQENPERRFGLIKIASEDYINFKK